MVTFLLMPDYIFPVGVSIGVFRYVYANRFSSYITQPVSISVPNGLRSAPARVRTYLPGVVELEALGSVRLVRLASVVAGQTLVAAHHCRHLVRRQSPRGFVGTTYFAGWN